MKDFGIEPEEFDELGLLEFVKSCEDKTTEGIFALGLYTKRTTGSTGGHDKLFAPQSKEDSDIFNRFHLLGLEFIQTWKGLVYHMTIEVVGSIHHQVVLR